MGATNENLDRFLAMQLMQGAQGVASPALQGAPAGQPRAGEQGAQARQGDPS